MKDDFIHEKERFLEELMAHIILAGGRRVEPSELEGMTIGRLLDMAYPNDIRFEIYSIRQRKNEYVGIL